MQLYSAEHEFFCKPVWRRDKFSWVKSERYPYLCLMNEAISLEERIHAFIRLGEILSVDHHPMIQNAVSCALNDNPWYTPEHIRYALFSLGKSLSCSNLHRWLKPYNDGLSRTSGKKTIGVVMAGNIPAVGFHDFLCVLMSGHHILAKVSSGDRHLIPALADILGQKDPHWNKMISFTDHHLTRFDAIIATGSNNTSRYFEHYFSKYPHIIRKNRNSIAVLTGNENDQELNGLADDIMLYFGMGCRSVSKIFVPCGYDFTRLIHAMEPFAGAMHHPKYRNNYDYWKSIFLVNKIPFYDSGFLLIREIDSILSPISVLHFEFYNAISNVSEQIKSDKEQIQCVVSQGMKGKRTILPGKAHKPELWDYADGVDTMDFLLSDFLV